MKISEILQRKSDFIPSWNHNADLGPEDQIRIHFRWPTFAEQADLVALSPLAGLAALVLGRMTNIASWNAANLLGIVKSFMDEDWAKPFKDALDDNLSEQELRRQLRDFAVSYCTKLVEKIDGLEELEITTGEQLVQGPADLFQLVFEIAFHIWNGQNLEKKTSFISPSDLSSKTSSRRASSKTAVRIRKSSK